MNVFQFDVCLNCYVLVYWLPFYWEIYEMQYLGYLSVRRYNSVNSFSTAYPVVFQMRQFMPHVMCRIHVCCPGVLWLHLSHRALESWDTTVTKMRIVERESSAFVGCSFQLIDRDSATLLHRCSELELRHGDSWFIIELIICYVLHRYLILPSLK